MVTILNINKTFNKRSKFPVKALQNINANIRKNQVTGLIGSNGAGKTTLIRIILGFESPDNGSIIINDKYNLDITSRKIIGYQSDMPFVTKSVKVFDYLDFNSKLSGYDNNESQIMEMLDYFLLTASANKKLSDLSKGMRQKLEIINAFLGKPKLVILDEPTAALDPFAVIELRDFISKQKETGITILFSSHHLSEVEKICDRVLFINQGLIVKDFGSDVIQQGMLEVEFTQFIKESN